MGESSSSKGRKKEIWHKIDGGAGVKITSTFFKVCQVGKKYFKKSVDKICIL